MLGEDFAVAGEVGGFEGGGGGFAVEGSGEGAEEGCSLWHELVGSIGGFDGEVFTVSRISFNWASILSSSGEGLGSRSVLEAYWA